MALCRECFALKGESPDFGVIKYRLETNTGLEIDLEVAASNVAFFSCDALASMVEVKVDLLNEKIFLFLGANKKGIFRILFFKCAKPLFRLPRFYP